jgi:hypothetical protein
MGLQIDIVYRIINTFSKLEIIKYVILLLPFRAGLVLYDFEDNRIIWKDTDLILCIIMMWSSLLKLLS